MKISDQIEKILSNEFNPKMLRVINNSFKHKGHLGDDGTGETHFLVEISSSDIPKKFIHEKHKLIVEKLAEVFKQTHSIEIKLI